MLLTESFGSIRLKEKIKKDNNFQKKLNISAERYR